MIRSQRREARQAGGEGSSKQEAESCPKSFLSLPSLPLTRSRQKRAPKASLACPPCHFPDSSGLLTPADGGQQEAGVLRRGNIRSSTALPRSVLSQARRLITDQWVAHNRCATLRIYKLSLWLY